MMKKHLNVVRTESFAEPLRFNGIEYSFHTIASADAFPG